MQHHKRTPEDATKPGKEIPEDSIVCCDMCGAPLREECGTTGLCSNCAELWESEIDLEDMEAEEWRKQKKAEIPRAQKISN